MKTMKIIRLMVMTLLFPGLVMASCTKEDNLTDIQVIEEIESNIRTGTWRIIKFIDSGTDETNQFQGYSFTFSINGVLTAANGVNTYAGTWSITDSNSNDDSPDDLDFNILFNLTNDFEDLNDDWDIITRSPAGIELIDISGGNGGTDYLTFEKN